VTNVPPRTLARSKPWTAAGACDSSGGGMMNDEREELETAGADMRKASGLILDAAVIVNKLPRTEERQRLYISLQKVHDELSMGQMHLDAAMNEVQP